MFHFEEEHISVIFFNFFIVFWNLRLKAGYEYDYEFLRAPVFIAVMFAYHHTVW